LLCPKFWKKAVGESKIGENQLVKGNTILLFTSKAVKIVPSMGQRSELAYTKLQSTLNRDLINGKAFKFKITWHEQNQTISTLLFRC